ncbi:hypothetical protein E4U41_000306 [Claviceps citrina]|nr:hypothetical protein E4U41_000306 [Claviceps citrina]
MPSSILKMQETMPKNMSLWEDFQKNESGAANNWANRSPAQRPPLLLLGPGVPLLLQNFDLVDEQRFVFADADNRRYGQKDHVLIQLTRCLTPPHHRATTAQTIAPSSGTLAPREEAESTGLLRSLVVGLGAHPFAGTRPSGVLSDWRRGPVAGNVFPPSLAWGSTSILPLALLLAIPGGFAR